MYDDVVGEGASSSVFGEIAGDVFAGVTADVDVVGISVADVDVGRIDDGKGAKARFADVGTLWTGAGCDGMGVEVDDASGYIHVCKMKYMEKGGEEVEGGKEDAVWNAAVSERRDDGGVWAGDTAVCS